MKVSTGQLARRYATALFESTIETKQIDVLSTEAHALIGVITPELELFFSSPARSALEKREMVQLLADKLGLSAPTSRALNLMAQNNRLSHLKLVMKKVLEKIDAHKNILRGQIRSASALSPAEISELEKALSQSLGQKVIFECQTEPQLRAGMVVNIGTRQIDASLKTRLSNLKEFLSQGV
jgi:F-type H+-transporting ATPase subunit delta